MNPQFSVCGRTVSNPQLIDATVCHGSVLITVLAKLTMLPLNFVSCKSIVCVGDFYCRQFHFCCFMHRLQYIVYVLRLRITSKISDAQLQLQLISNDYNVCDKVHKTTECKM